MSKSFRDLAESTATPESQRVASERTVELLREEVARLLLTDAEREAIEAAIPLLTDGAYVDYDGTLQPDRRATLRSLLERLAGADG